METDASRGQADLAPVLKSDGEIDLLEVGRIDYAELHGDPLSAQERAAWDWLAANGGGRCIQAGARKYAAHLEEEVRQDGGTIIKERHDFTNGRPRLTRTVRHFPSKVATGTVSHTSVRQARARGAGRPRASASRSSSKSGDSGDSGLSEPPGETAGPHLHLVPDPAPRGGTYSYGCLSAEERGADVEPVDQ